MGEATKYSVEVRPQLGDALPGIQCDRVQPQQVALNLISNAIEAMSSVTEGVRKLLISTGATEPDSLLVTVRDSGARTAGRDPR